MKQAILELITYYSMIYGVNPAVAISVAEVESSLNPAAIGAIGEVGLYQTNPEFFPTAPMRADWKLQVEWGVARLAEMRRRCKHKLNYSWVVCYNLGVKGGSRIKNPYGQSYYKKVIRRINEKLAKRI